MSQRRFKTSTPNALTQLRRLPPAKRRTITQTLLLLIGLAAAEPDGQPPETPHSLSPGERQPDVQG